jgi:hypothetical protein
MMDELLAELEAARVAIVEMETSAMLIMAAAFSAANSLIEVGRRAADAGQEDLTRFAIERAHDVVSQLQEAKPV